MKKMTLPLTRNDALDALHNFIMEVVFTKKDGTERLMICTLSKEYLPETYVASGKKINPEVISVFDLENSAWRSFRLDSVKVFTAYVRV